jgi:protease-4
MGWVVYAVRWLAWLIAQVPRRFRRPPDYVSFVLEGPDPDLPQPPGQPPWRRLLGPAPRAMLDLAAQFDLIARDPRVRGVVLHLRVAAYTAAQAETLAGLVAELRAAGKRVVCWATSYSNPTYRIACAADEILLQPGGQVSSLGIGGEYLYLADALARVGAEADFIQVAPYKTAGDVLSKREMTPEAREMANWLADSQFNDLVGAVAAGRGLDQSRARALIDGAPYTDLQAQQAGVIDHILGEEELPARLGGNLQPWPLVRRKLRRIPPRRPGRYVGLIRVMGTIIDGHTRRPPLRPPIPAPFVFDEQTGDLTVVRQIRQLARDRRAAAVLLWVDSHGGSATASEAIQAALKTLAMRKPLVAAMGSVAASGGYYVTTAAQHVFAQSGTLTGSIGVIGGKVVVGELLDRLLFRRELISRGAHAGMSRLDQPYSEQERNKVREWIDRIYQLFLQRVAEARQKTPQAIEPVAGGRVWTGRQALEHELVDELGGLQRALAMTRKLGNLPSDAPLRELPAKVEQAPQLPGAAALDHVLHLFHVLGRPAAWLLSPFLVERTIDP